MSPMLVVAIVRDPELRDALVRRLSHIGANLIVTPDHKAVARRRLRKPALLVIDEAAMDGEQGEWVSALWRERRWQRVVVLTIDTPLPASERDWMLYLDRKSAAETLAQLVGDPAHSAAA